MRYLLWGAAAAVLAASSSSASEANWYVSLEAGLSETGAGGGYTWSEPFFNSFVVIDALEESLTFMGTIGTRLSDDFRLEAEIGRRSGEQWMSEISQTTLMLNAAYDIEVLDRLSITLGAGAGFDLLSLETPRGDVDDIALAYQGLIGVSYELTPSTDITLTYRHFNTLDVDAAESTPTSSVWLSGADDTTISVGLRFDL